MVYSLLQVFCDVAEIAEKTTNTGDIIRCWLDSVSVLSDIIQRISKLFEVFNSLVNKVLTWWGGLSIRYDWPPEVWHLNLIQAFLCRFTPWLHCVMCLFIRSYLTASRTCCNSGLITRYDLRARANYWIVTD